MWKRSNELVYAKMKQAKIFQFLYNFVDDINRRKLNQISDVYYLAFWYTMYMFFKGQYIYYQVYVLLHKWKTRCNQLSVHEVAEGNM